MDTGIVRPTDDEKSENGSRVERGLGLGWDFERRDADDTGRVHACDDMFARDANVGGDGLGDDEGAVVASVRACGMDGEEVACVASCTLG